MDHILMASIVVYFFFFPEINNYIREFFKHECPACEGAMKCHMYDAEFDKNVYKCDDCKKEWI